MALNVPNPSDSSVWWWFWLVAVDKHRASIPESARGPGPASHFDALSSVEATAPARQQQQ